MARLDRTYCDICNKPLPSMGYYKLKDGCMCASCSKAISPLLKNRRDKTTEYIRRHIEYREENKKKICRFRASIAFGYDKKIYIDPYMSAFVVTKRKEEDICLDNPDIIMLSQVVSCDTDIKEYTKEEYNQNEEGEKESYYPPHLRHFYDFKTEIVLNNEWFDKIVVDLNGESVEGKGSIRYQKCSSIAKQIKDTLLYDRKKSVLGVKREDSHLFRL